MNIHFSIICSENCVKFLSARDLPSFTQVEKDVPAAADMFARACSTTNPRSCVAIARLLQFGKFVERDYKKVLFIASNKVRYQNKLA